MLKPIEQKYILVPDCDDDRAVHVRDQNGSLQRLQRNPRHIREQARIYFTGKPVWNEQEGCFLKGFVVGDWPGFWSPALTLEWKDGQLQEVPYETKQQNWHRKYLAGFLALMYFDPEKSVYRISLVGGDDTSYQRYNLSQEKAQNIWKRLNHHITIKSIRRLGFQAE